MEAGTLGREYADGEIICRQNEPGERMYVVQSGMVEVLREEAGREVVVGELTIGEVFGEMAIFEKEHRSATVRAKGQALVLSLDKKTFLKRVHEDPSLAYRILQGMSKRIRRLNTELVRLKVDSVRVEKKGDMTKYLFIISRDQTDLYQEMARDFLDVQEVQIILDRRSGQRPQGDGHHVQERRQAKHPNQHKALAIELSQSSRTGNSSNSTA